MFDAGDGVEQCAIHGAVEVGPDGIERGRIYDWKTPTGDPTGQADRYARALGVSGYRMTPSGFIFPPYRDPFEGLSEEERAKLYDPVWNARWLAGQWDALRAEGLAADAPNRPGVWEKEDGGWRLIAEAEFPAVLNEEGEMVPIPLTRRPEPEFADPAPDRVETWRDGVRLWWRSLRSVLADWIAPNG